MYDAFGRAEPILTAMGKAVIHAGGPGAGAAAKICNNMLLGASMIATCETLRLAEKLGLDLPTFYDIASRSSGQCWSLTSYCPVPGVGPETPADQGYQGGFATALMLKDLKLALGAAGGAGANVPLGERAERLYEDFAASGHGSLDFSAIIKALQAGGDFSAASIVGGRARSGLAAAVVLIIMAFWSGMVSATKPFHRKAIPANAHDHPASAVRSIPTVPGVCGIRRESKTAARWIAACSCCRFCR